MNNVANPRPGTPRVRATAPATGGSETTETGRPTGVPGGEGRD